MKSQEGKGAARGRLMVDRNPGGKAAPAITPFRRLRLLRGYSLVRIAGLAQCAPSTLTKLERGGDIGGMSVGVLLRIAVAMECSVLDLVPGLATRYRAQVSPVSSVRRGHVGQGSPRPHLKTPEYREFRSRENKRAWAERKELEAKGVEVEHWPIGPRGARGRTKTRDEALETFDQDQAESETDE